MPVGKYVTAYILLLSINYSNYRVNQNPIESNVNKSITFLHGKMHTLFWYFSFFPFSRRPLWNSMIDNLSAAVMQWRSGLYYLSSPLPRTASNSSSSLHWGQNEGLLLNNFINNIRIHFQPSVPVCLWRIPSSYSGLLPNICHTPNLPLTARWKK